VGSLSFETIRGAAFRQEIGPARSDDADDLARMEAVIERSRRFRAGHRAFLTLCEKIVRPAMIELGEQLAATGHGYRIEVRADRSRITFYLFKQGAPFSDVSAPTIAAFLTLSGVVGWVRTLTTPDGMTVSRQSNPVPLSGTTKTFVTQKVGRWIREVTEPKAVRDARPARERMNLMKRRSGGRENDGQRERRSRS